MFGGSVSEESEKSILMILQRVNNIIYEIAQMNVITFSSFSGIFFCSLLLHWLVLPFAFSDDDVFFLPRRCFFCATAFQENE